ncbi:MAG: thioesterase [Rhodothalassiaceae bacterium]|nr:MAG: thioesterase [Rhodothalassiaceae bacterium]
MSHPWDDETLWPRRLAAWPCRERITTRWRDNDVYGHLNNTVYYEFFDAVINARMIRAGLLDPLRSPAYGIVAETACRYLSSLAYPQEVTVGFGVARLGRTSVVWHLAVFGAEEGDPAALGRFVHVFVARGDGRPTPVPDALRAHLEGLRLAGA